MQPRHSPPVTPALQSRALQEIRCDCALRVFYLPASHTDEANLLPKFLIVNFEVSFSDPWRFDWSLAPFTTYPVLFGRIQTC